MISKNKIKYIHSLELKKKRKEEKAFVAEGPKLIQELMGHFECICLAATADWMEENQDWAKTYPTDCVTEDELRKISFLDTPQKVLAVFRQRDCRPDPSVITKSLCLAIDGVQNPGNLGTIVRLADWFGIEHIFCSKSSADIYNPKTVQATMGGMARVCVHYCDLPKLIASLPSGTPVYGTFLNGDNIYSESLEQHGLIVMGNEGKGVSDEVASLVTNRLYIPNYPTDRQTSESLNVAIATAIICAEFRRRG
ncbi:MAG: RNA methyltransferase [Bacteroides sp.]|nr:RNA methyltransferase [Roseburia sp.]MCM1347506.1 RNA methyltransferase [Bacteroides sp.]MCM1422015.1 RNA methyltransferase [Bacteroides sp.]